MNILVIFLKKLEKLLVQMGYQVPWEQPAIWPGFPSPRPEHESSKMYQLQNFPATQWGSDFFTTLPPILVFIQKAPSLDAQDDSNTCRALPSLISTLLTLTLQPVDSTLQQIRGIRVSREEH